MKCYAYAIENGEMKPDYFAQVRGDSEVSHTLALRHARAMKAVLVAAVAWGKEYDAPTSMAALNAKDKRLTSAVRRLGEIEKEMR